MFFKLSITKHYFIFLELEFPIFKSKNFNNFLFIITTICIIAILQFKCQSKYSTKRYSHCHNIELSSKITDRFTVTLGEGYGFRGITLRGSQHVYAI